MGWYHLQCSTMQCTIAISHLMGVGVLRTRVSVLRMGVSILRMRVSILGMGVSILGKLQKNIVGLARAV